jgi:hypothetical protein
MNTRSTMPILVTGGTGTIGTRVVRMLREQGESVRVLVDLALGEPSGSVPDLAGPEVLDVDQVLTPLLAIRGSHRPRWHLRIPGAIGRAYRSGENLAAADARRSGVTWSDYLAARLASEGRV